MEGDKSEAEPEGERVRGGEEGLKPQGDEEGSRVGRVYIQGFRPCTAATITTMKICCLIIMQLIMD